MRRALVLLGLPVAWVACFSNSSGGPAGPTFDASFDGAEFDAYAPDGEPEAAADGTAPVEASPPVDAAPPSDAPEPVDAATFDVGPSPAVVTVIGVLGPEKGIPIFWSDATGALASTATTDATGSATALVTGGMVTALLGTVVAPSYYTVMGVQPGNRILVVDRTSVQAISAPNGVWSQLTAIPSPTPPIADTLVYYAGNCNVNYFPGMPTQLRIDKSNLPGECYGIGSFGSGLAAAYPALVEVDDVNNNLIEYAVAKDNQVTAPDDAGQLDVALNGSWSTATTTQTVVAQNPLDASFTTTWNTYNEIADGVEFSLPQRSFTPDGGTAPPGGLIFTGHTGYPDFVQTELGANTNYQGGFAVATRMAAPTQDGTTNVDLSPLATLPTLVSASGSIGANGLSVQWTTASGDLSSSTAVLALAEWSGTLPTGGSQLGTWTIVAPGTSQTSLLAPTLPGGAGVPTPDAGASVGVVTVYALSGDTAYPTYADVAAAASLFQLQDACIFATMFPPLPKAGTALASGYTTGLCP
jgi:hypothetical protein